MSTKQRVGRPTLPPAHHRCLVRVFLNEQEKATLNQAAKRAGKTLSAWVRERARRAAMQELKDVWTAP